MYRDIIEEPVKIEIDGSTFYYQQFNRWDGNLKSVNLYDEDGDFVCEFDSIENMIEFARGMKA